jgi:hypothetical protein
MLHYACPSPGAAEPSLGSNASLGTSTPSNSMSRLAVPRIPTLSQVSITRTPGFGERLLRKRVGPVHLCRTGGNRFGKLIR